MPATDTLEQELLDLIFLNLAFDNIGDVAGILPSAAAGSVEISLHTGTLTDASNQNTTEAAYTGYARVAVARGAAQWTVLAGLVDNDNAITFPTSTSGPETETDFGIGSAIVANELWLYGVLTASLVVNNGVQPEFAIGDLDITVT